MSDTTTTADDDDTQDADLSAGFDSVGKPDDHPAATQTPEGRGPAADEPAQPAPEAKKYVQITEQDWAEMQAAARKTASYDQQLSKAWGTIGQLQRAAAAGRKVEIPKEAFAAMERDFPELAQQTRSALEAALAGISGGGGAETDPAAIEAMLAQHTSKRELETLEDAYPEWRKIVGAVDASREQPDPNHPFRKWLAGKPAEYQTRVNASESAAVIGRAIRLFQNETKPAARPTRSNVSQDTRAERIAAAVQPRGDSQGAPAGPSEDDEFRAGFNSR